MAGADPEGCRGTAPLAQPAAPCGSGTAQLTATGGAGLHLVESAWGKR